MNIKGHPGVWKPPRLRGYHSRTEPSEGCSRLALRCLAPEDRSTLPGLGQRCPVGAPFSFGVCKPCHLQATLSLQFLQ